MADDTTTAPLSDEATPAVELLLAAVYACAGRLDRDELTNEAGEPLRIIGAAFEDALGLDVKLDQGFLYERGLAHAESGELGLAHAVDGYLMPTAVVRDRLDDVDLAAILAEHPSAGYESSTDLFRCVCGHRFTGSDAEFAEHRAKVVRAALLGEA